jgi:adenylate cyclase
MTASTACRTCGIELRDGARFCDACGAQITSAAKPAEYKQVTVLFADVVRSMDMAAALGPERLRDIMTELVNRCAVVVERYGGTVDKFTGDGIMAVFGAPLALEDHGYRACLAALGIQLEAERLSRDVERRDRTAMQLRVGLNSGEVIAGEIGSGPMSYTAIGEQVGMAQRMESVAPPGGVMLSESTARLVENAAVLGEPEVVRIKGAGDPVAARLLVAVAAQRGSIGRRESTLVGREWELAALGGMLDRAVSGHGCVVGVCGPPGIGKSRIAAEIAAVADKLGVQVFSTFCESHANEVPFHAVARLLRAALGVDEIGVDAARARVRAQIPGADAADLVLLDDMLGVRDPAVELPDIAPDARRRRLTALVNAASLARSTPNVYVIEDAHWIDQISEAMLAEFITVIPQTPSLVLVTYRPEYRGALGRTAGAQTIALAPLDDSQTEALIAELLGPHPSVAGLTTQIAERAAGNPFFAEEIVRDLADRGVLNGVHGAYGCPGDTTDTSVPATLQAAIAARIDRLDTGAKRTLYAAAVIGLRFGADLLASLVDSSAAAELVHAELIDQVMFTPRAEYAFRHPLIRTVAYGSQLKSGRAELHRRLAAAIEQQNPGSLDENAALIAQHLEAAGDLQEAFGWHMRAGTWSTNRDIRAARMSWKRARQVADRLPADDLARTSMRIAPRTLLCGSAWRSGETVADTGFDELRELTSAADDKVSLAVGMAGQVTMLVAHARFREASQLAAEYISLMESLGDPTLTIALLYAAMAAKRFTGEIAEVLRLAERVIDLADGDAQKGNLIIGSPLAAAITFRGAARCYRGLPGWKDDIEQAVTMVRAFDPTMRALVLLYGYGVAIGNGALLFDATVLRETAETLELAERSGDDFTLATARFVRGITLVQQEGPEREEGFDLLAQVREAILRECFSVAMMSVLELQNAKEKIRTGDLGGAIKLSRAVVDREFDTGEMIYRGAAVTVLVESLLHRGRDADVQEAQAAIDRLAAVPTEPGFVVYEVALLRMRALLARAYGDEVGYRQLADRYREMAVACGFEGHIAMADTMTTAR